MAQPSNTIPVAEGLTPTSVDVGTYPARQFIDAALKKINNDSEPAYGCRELIKSSAKSLQVRPERNGFVHGALEAYKRRHNLVISPDDVWIAILAQINTYVNSNAESLRETFVSHKGKDGITLVADGESRFDLDCKWMAQKFVGILRAKVNNPEVVEVIVKGFSTTKDNETIINCAMMMGTVKAYFEYKVIVIPRSAREDDSSYGGIPSITLLGKKEDYLDMLVRLTTLGKISNETAAFEALLRPIITQFAAAFDRIASNETPDGAFWQRMVYADPDATVSDTLSGWITAFCAWAPPKDGANDAAVWRGEPVDVILRNAARKSSSEGGVAVGRTDSGALTLDGVPYLRVTKAGVPLGYCDVDVLVVEETHRPTKKEIAAGAEVDPGTGGQLFRCVLLAGHVGYSATGFVAVQPAPQWFLFEKKNELM